MANRTRLFSKMLVTALVCALVGLLCAGCSNEAAQKPEQEAAPVYSAESISVMGLKGPTGIGMAQLMDSKASASDSVYDFSLVGAPDQVISALANGEADIALIPTNLAATLYRKTNGSIQMIAVNALGSLYLLENGTAITDIASLKGKTVYATGQGSNPQYVLEYLLRQAGLTVGTDVFVEYLSEHSELAARVADGSVGIALLPEPYASVALSKNSDYRVAIDFNEAWSQSGSEYLPLGCAVATTEFIEAHPGDVDAFLGELENSIAFAQEDTAATAQLCVDLGIIANADVAQSAVPRCAVTFIDGAAMKDAVMPFFKVLYAANPSSVGGALPDDGLFYTRK